VYWLALGLSGREVLGSHPGHATILLGSNLGQVEVDGMKKGVDSTGKVMHI